MHKHFPDVLRFADAEPLSERSDGKYDLNGEGAFAIIETYGTKEASDCFIECHRKYIDVQLVIQGIECIGFCRREECDEHAYDEEKDFQKLEGDPDLLTFREGTFMVFYPDDAHMPKVKYGDSSETVKKVVFKIPV